MAYGGYGGGSRLGVISGLEDDPRRVPFRQPTPAMPTLPRAPGQAVGGYSPGDPFAGGVGQGSGALLRQAGQYGYFSPEGSDRFRGLNRRRILGMGRNRRNRAGLLARLSGLDRMGTQSALQEADRDAMDFQSNALNEFDVGEYGQNRDFFRSLLGQERGYEEQRRLAEEQRKAEQGGFWGGLGQLAGGAGLNYLTAFLPKRR